ncbi:MAG: 2-keto-4-pentenoate hydratase [Planctomycetaceae bacterium]|jgi:2-keto-4-pentenoate hydratase
MNQRDAISDSQFSEWATRQLADYDAHSPGSIFGEGVVLSVAQGYDLQAAVARLRCERGERIIGYKVGCTSPTIRSQLGIDHCVTGRLYDSERHSTGSELSRQTFANLAIEGELAVELAHEPTERDFHDADRIPSCVARVFPAIELHHHVLRGKRPSAGELIAHNAINGGFVEGTGIGADEFSDDSSLAIFADDQLLEGCKGPALVQTIHSSLKWLTGIVQERGDRLVAGQIILTGSIPSLIPISHNCRVRVEARPFGSVDATFIS